MVLSFLRKDRNRLTIVFYPWFCINFSSLALTDHFCTVFWIFPRDQKIFWLRLGFLPSSLWVRVVRYESYQDRKALDRVSIKMYNPITGLKHGSLWGHLYASNFIASNFTIYFFSLKWSVLLKKRKLALKWSISWGITNLEAVISGFVLSSKFVFIKRDMIFFLCYDTTVCESETPADKTKDSKIFHSHVKMR